jgi:hypothetical protein
MSLLFAGLAKGGIGGMGPVPAVVRLQLPQVVYFLWFTAANILIHKR